MNLQQAFESLKTAFMSSKDVTVEELGLVLTLEPPDNLTETAITEACSDVEGAAYIEAIKDHSLAHAIRALNGERIPDIIQYTDEKGEKVETTRYLYMLGQVRTWVQPLKDTVFDAYSDLLAEIQKKIETTVKFDRVPISPSTVTAPAPDNFTRVEEPKEDLTDAEMLTKQVQKEQEAAQQTMAQTESRAMGGVKG